MNSHNCSQKVTYQFLLCKHIEFDTDGVPYGTLCVTAWQFVNSQLLTTPNAGT